MVILAMMEPFHHRCDHHLTSSRNTTQLLIPSTTSITTKRKATTISAKIVPYNECDDPTTTLTIPKDAQSCITKIESIISRDEGGRGIQPLVVPGDLLHTAVVLARLTSASLPLPLTYNQDDHYNSPPYLFCLDFRAVFSTLLP